VDFSPAIMIGLWVVILAALVWIAVRLRPGASEPVTHRLESAVELLKAELVSRQTESLLALRQSIDTANKIINDRLAEGTTSLDRRMMVLSDIQQQLGKLEIQTARNGRQKHPVAFGTSQAASTARGDWGTVPGEHPGPDTALSRFRDAAPIRQRSEG